ncbi:hypothetical protein [Streptomyces albiflavescens]|nr:hypothetical protein [Streptomyces albiflavescens]
MTRPVAVTDVIAWWTTGRPHTPVIVPDGVAASDPGSTTRAPRTQGAPA